MAKRIPSCAVLFALIVLQMGVLHAVQHDLHVFDEPAVSVHQEKSAEQPHDSDHRETDAHSLTDCLLADSVGDQTASTDLLLSRRQMPCHAAAAALLLPTASLSEHPARAPPVSL